MKTILNINQKDFYNKYIYIYKLIYNIICVQKNFIY